MVSLRTSPSFPAVSRVPSAKSGTFRDSRLGRSRPRSRTDVVFIASRFSSVRTRLGRIRRAGFLSSARTRRRLRRTRRFFRRAGQRGFRRVSSGCRFRLQRLAGIFQRLAGPRLIWRDRRRRVYRNVIFRRIIMCRRFDLLRDVVTRFAYEFGHAFQPGVRYGIAFGLRFIGNFGRFFRVGIAGRRFLFALSANRATH